MPTFRLVKQVDGRPVAVTHLRTAKTQATEVLADMVAQLHAAGWHPAIRHFTSQIEYCHPMDGWQPYV
jgi:Ser/Thr protein kinase RdoA (MazF antagonist)